MSDHETTLLEIGAEELRKLESLPSVNGQPPKSEAAVRFRARHAACLAGADALRRGTCANCDHRIDWPDAIGCDNARGLNRDEVSPGDFCSQWAPRRDAPTEPTR